MYLRHIILLQRIDRNRDDAYESEEIYIIGTVLLY